MKTVNVKKAPGPDGIASKVLKNCSHQLAEVLTDIFNLSLEYATVPSCLKSATIIPAPKLFNIILNDYRPVALTPVVAKCFERIFLRHIKTTLSPTLDQYAYKTNSSTEHGLNTVLYTAKSHMEQKEAYVRILFVYYRSTFNTIVLCILGKKLQHLGLHEHLWLWIIDILTNCPQKVRLGSHSSPVC